MSSGVSFCSQKKIIIISFDVINKTDIFKGKAVHFLGGRGLLQMYLSSRPRRGVGINMFTSENQSQSNSHLKPLTDEMPQQTQSQYQFLSTEKVINDLFSKLPLGQVSLNRAWETHSQPACRDSRGFANRVSKQQTNKIKLRTLRLPNILSDRPHSIKFTQFIINFRIICQHHI